MKTYTASPATSSDCSSVPTTNETNLRKFVAQTGALVPVSGLAVRMLLTIIDHLRAERQRPWRSLR